MKNSTKIIIILCLISSLARYALDSYLPSLPAIREYFLLSYKNIQLTLTLYLLGFGLSQLIYGPLSDLWGRKKILVMGLSIFLFGNLFCAFALTSSMIFICRFIAGIGAGSLGVLNRAIASDCFKGNEFSKAWSITTTTLVLTLCLAPVMGGYIQESWDWRANFYVVTLFTMIVLMTVLKFLPETNHHGIQKKLCIKKIITNYQEVLRSKIFLMEALTYTLAFAGLIAYFQISPLLFIEQLHFTPSEYGWSSLIIAGMYLLGGFIVNRSVDRLGIDKLLYIGKFLLLYGGIILWIISSLPYKNMFTIIFPTAIFVLGARIIIPNAIANSMINNRHLSGSSSAVLGCIQMVGSALISILIAQFDHGSTFPLAFLFMSIGSALLLISLIKKSGWGVI